MSTTTGTIGLSVQAREGLAVSASRLVQYDVPIQATHNLTISDGTGAGTYILPNAAVKATKTYQASGTLASTTIDIDLTAVTCADGSTGFSYVRWGIILCDGATTAYNLVVGLGTNPFDIGLSGTTPTFTIKPGVPFIFGEPLSTNGMTVDSSHKILRLNSGSNSVPYRVLFWGN